MPILTPALETETSRKTGLELRKPAPMRTDSGLPFTEILTAPLCASERAAVRVGWPFLVAAVVPTGGGEVVEPEPVDPASPVVAVTCWTNGSLLAKLEKPVSCPFERLGGMSEVVSFVLVAGIVAAAATPGAVVAGV